MTCLGDVLFQLEEAEKVVLCKECLIQGDRYFLTFSGARLVLDDFGAWLRPRLSHIQVVAFLAHNSADFFFAVVAAASIVAPALLNTRWTANEIASALTSGPRIHGTILLLHDDDNTGKANEAARRMRTASSGITVHVQQLPSIVHRRMQMRTGTTTTKNANQDDGTAKNSSGTTTKAAATSRTSIVLSNEDAMIVFTSGTTKAAKGVCLSHNAIFCQALIKHRYYDGETRLLATTQPFYHIGGISSILSTWLAGGCIVLEDTAAVTFEPSRTMTLLHRLAINAVVVVPAMLYALHDFASKDTSSTKLVFHNVRLVLIGGQSAPEPLLTFARTAFPNARLVQTFACTEAASSLAFLDVTMGQPSGRVGECVGEPSVDVAIVANDDDNNKITMSKFWSVGRISTRGPHVMNGYWGQTPHASNDWFISNDLGCWDDQGRLWFCGRTTDTIRTGGETVFCTEVERTLKLHPSIRECAVFGMADDRFGECVCAAVAFKGGPIDIERIKAFCFGNGLAGYKQPKRLIAVDKLPRNSAGKVVKRLLVEQCSGMTRRSNIMLTSKL
jgi:acyl-CoA synthetase (AMP-forming)/AMP-acid ligase II